MMSEADRVTSIRQAAAACNVTPSVVRRWRFLGLIPEPPWTLQQLHQVRELRAGSHTTSTQLVNL
jgi:DNA-binding transcriptional MerR regulator